MKYLLVLLVCCSCGATYHLKQAKKHELIAIAKGAKISRDTIFKDIPLTIYIPGKTDSVQVGPVIDFTEFMKMSDNNDRLILAIDSLQDSHLISREFALRQIKHSRMELAVVKARLAKGFSKDSTYIFNADSITKVMVTTKDGLVQRIKMVKRGTSVRVTKKIPMVVDSRIWSGATTYQVVVLAILMLLIGTVATHFYENRTTSK